MIESKDKATSGSAVAGSTNLDPDKYVASIWSSKILPTVQKQAVELPTLLNDLERDPAATAKRFGHYAIDGGPPSFLVKGSGRVVSVDTLSARSTAGITSLAESCALIEVGPVLSGSDIRDALPFINFNQFVNQVQYGEVAISINARVTDKVLIQLDTDKLKGKRVVFTGAYTAPDPNAPCRHPHCLRSRRSRSRCASESPRLEIDVVVRAESVSKVFASTVALNHVDFNVYRGKVNALVGENGGRQVDADGRARRRPRADAKAGT